MLLCRAQGNDQPRVRAREEDFFPVGVEIEYENVPIFPEVQGWQVHTDGSLRNHGVEYVTSGPVLTRRGTAIKINRLCEVARENRFGTSVRTGIHVHVNMQDVDHGSLRNILLSYILAEPALYQYAGEWRHINPYCVPWFAAPEIAEQSMRALHLLDRGSLTPAYNILGRTNKYAGLYIGPLRRFGTIEFRHLPTTLDADIIMEWVNLVQQVVQYGVRTDLVQQSQDMDVEDMLTSMFQAIPLLGQHTDMYESTADAAAVFDRALPWYTTTLPTTAWVMVKDKPRPKNKPPKKRLYRTALDLRRLAEEDTIMQAARELREPAARRERDWAEILRPRPMTDELQRDADALRREEIREQREAYYTPADDDDWEGTPDEDEED